MKNEDGMGRANSQVVLDRRGIICRPWIAVPRDEDPPTPSASRGTVGRAERKRRSRCRQVPRGLAVANTRAASLSTPARATGGMAYSSPRIRVGSRIRGRTGGLGDLALIALKRLGGQHGRS